MMYIKIKKYVGVKRLNIIGALSRVLGWGPRKCCQDSRQELFIVAATLGFPGLVWLPSPPAVASGSHTADSRSVSTTGVPLLPGGS